MQRKFKFITFEGLDGSGKSTQTELLVGGLREKGYMVVATREPGGTRIGDQIRKITHDPENVDLTAIAEAYLMAAARAQHVLEIIRPALTEGKIVVCDRFIDSSLAYQGFGRELGWEQIWQLNKLAIGKTIPDITFLLQVDIKEGMRRRNRTNKMDRLDLQQREFYERVEKGYNLLVKEFRERIVVVDGNKSIKAVAEDIWKHINKFLISNF